MAKSLEVIPKRQSKGLELSLSPIRPLAIDISHPDTNTRLKLVLRYDHAYDEYLIESKHYLPAGQGVMG